MLSVDAAASPADIPSEGAAVAAKPPTRVPSAHVKQIAAELLALPPKELTMLRKAVRERLIAKPSKGGPLPKQYNPEIKVKRSDAPFPMRSGLRNLGNRISGLHPAHIFAGQGPSIIPVPMPALTSAIMGFHAEEMMKGMVAQQPLAAEAAPAAAAAPAEAASGEEGDEQAAEEKQPAKEEVLKANVTIKLLSYEAKKKISVVKEVRAITALGLKESKDLVEGAPKVLKKGVKREEAEAFVEKLRAAGAEVSIE